MFQNGKHGKEFERELRLSNVRTLLLLDQAHLLSTPLPDPVRTQLWAEYRQAEMEKYAEFLMSGFL